MTRVLFVNSGILGMQSFSTYIREAMARHPGVQASHINLSEHLTVDERIVRYLLCARLWPDGLLGLKNLDLARLRQEFHAGLQAARRIRRVVRSGGVDVLHFHRQATAYASVGLLRRVPAIVSIDCTQRTVLDNARSALERLTHAPSVALERCILRHAAAIVSASQWAADGLRRQYPECRTPVHVMHPPVRTRFFDEGWIEERAQRATKGYRPRVLFIGGDFVRKGGGDLLAAWRDGELHRSANLDLVTDWPVEPLSLPGVRIIRGVAAYSAEWSKLWRAADVFVMPTRDEAFGTVFQEAAAAGLPRIGTRINAIPETIADGESGLLIEPGDGPGLVDRLRMLIESPALRLALGTSARDSVLRRASAEKYRDSLCAIIESVMAARSRAASCGSGAADRRALSHSGTLS